MGIGSSGSSTPDASAEPSATATASDEVDGLKADLEKAEARVSELETAAEEAAAEPVETQAPAETEAPAAEEPVAEEPAAPPVAEAPPAPEAPPAASLSQQNAIGSAESYLDFSAFSRTGLIGQLEFEGFSTEDATFAVDSIAPDWNAQAAEKAQSYLDFSTFSRQGLIDQLVFEGFSVAEAEHGATAVGY